ncbi:MAG: hypothetical protein JWL87_687 [Candidatus Adlerbacteria bacterium]|nr:hypothetical protein [Candidatus Adlerbacteria bacterium]
MHTRLAAKLFLALALFLGAAAPAWAATEDAINGRLSGNWSGYVATRDKYTGVGATWTVPALAATTTLMTDVAWLGIGGSKSKDLIQAGTQGAVQNGKTQYWAWYELLPDYQVVVPFKVAAGDRVSASLFEITPGFWHLSFFNLTTGAEFQKALEYRSKYSSVEWIQEMPKVFSKDSVQLYAPLSEFGSVTFSNAFAIVNGKYKSAEDARARAVTMVSKQGKVPLATPSEIEEGTFTVVRSKAVAAPAASGNKSSTKSSDIVWSRN